MSEPVAYLLGELDAPRSPRSSARWPADAALRAEVERLRPVVSKLERLPADAWQDPMPPPLRMPPDDDAGARRAGSSCARSSPRPARSCCSPQASGSARCWTASPRRRRSSC